MDSWLSLCNWSALVRALSHSGIALKTPKPFGGVQPLALARKQNESFEMTTHSAASFQLITVYGRACDRGSRYHAHQPVQNTKPCQCVPHYLGHRPCLLLCKVPTAYSLRLCKVGRGRTYCAFMRNLRASSCSASFNFSQLRSLSSVVSAWPMQKMTISKISSGVISRP